MDNNVKLEKLRAGIMRAIQEFEYNDGIKLMACYCNILYRFNQIYFDEFIEDAFIKISDNLNPNINLKEEGKYDIVFYDGFGLDNRGLVQIYLKGLLRNGYTIKYIVRKNHSTKLRNIQKILTAQSNKIIYLKEDAPVNLIEIIISEIISGSPTCAFFYSTPSDVMGAIAFRKLEKITRYLIDLTDHTFWIGINAVDYILEFRDLGGNISYYFRKLNKNKLIKQPVYPIYDPTLEFKGFPFKKCEDSIVIFSGGSLYKTISPKGEYYRFIEECLLYNSNVIFWYAGSGDTSLLNRLIVRFPNRVFYTKEREDLFQIMRNVDICLNTFPISGGLMMQYSAVAEKVPLTLVSSIDDRDILINQANIGVEFFSYNDMLQEIRKMIDDELYRKYKNSIVIHSVIDSEEFNYNLRKIIDNQKSDFPIHFKQINIEDLKKQYFKSFGENGFENSISIRLIPLLIKYTGYFGFVCLYKNILNKIRMKVKSLCK